MENTAHHWVYRLMGGREGAIHAIFSALLSDEPEDLEEALEKIDEISGMPPQFRQDVEELKVFRKQLYRRKGDLTPEQRALLEKEDETMTMDLVEQLDGYGRIPSEVKPVAELTPS